MILKTVTLPLLPLLGVLITTGCGNTLYVGTETKSGLSVTSTANVPNDVGLSYRRSEVTVLPKLENGETVSVYGGSDQDFSWTEGSIISQNFATGNAAVLASGGTLSDPNPSMNNQGDTLLFTTSTTFGLNLHFGDSGTPSPTLLLGYRRAEGVIMPLEADATDANSIYADISIVYDSGGNLRKNLNAAPPEGRPRDNIAANRLPSSKNGVRIKQQFATGKAAENAVGKPEIKSKLNEAAGAISFADVNETLNKLNKLKGDNTKESLAVSVGNDVINTYNTGLSDLEKYRPLASFDDLLAWVATLNRDQKSLGEFNKKAKTKQLGF